MLVIRMRPSASIMEFERNAWLKALIILMIYQILLLL